MLSSGTVHANENSSIQEPEVQDDFREQPDDVACNGTGIPPEADKRDAVGNEDASHASIHSPPDAGKQGRARYSAKRAVFPRQTYY